MAKRSNAQGVRRVPRVLLLLLLLAPLSLHAETTPLQVITSGMRKPEIVLVLDTSGSMHWHPTGSWKNLGTDCNQDLFNITDLTQDGVCTGNETAANSSADCNITSNSSASAGSAPSCDKDNSPPSSGASRMYSVKRVLRGLLPGLRSAADFGLVTFTNTGYYQYYRGDDSCNCNQCLLPGTHTAQCTSDNCGSALCTSTDYGPYWTSGRCKCTKVSGGTRNAVSNSCNALGDPTCGIPTVCTGGTNNCTCPAATRTCQKVGSPPCCSCPAGQTLSCTNDANCATCTCKRTTYVYADCCDCSAAGAGYSLSNKCFRANADRDDCRCKKQKGWHFLSGFKWKNATCNCPPPAAAPTCDSSCNSNPSPLPATCTPAPTKSVTTLFTETELKALNLWVNEAPKPSCDPGSEDCGWRDRAAATPSWTGTRLTLLSLVPTSSSISATNKLKDSLYRCTSDGTKEARWQWSAVGRAHTTNAYGCSSWEYLGSYYTYEQTVLASPSYYCSSPNCQTTPAYRGPQWTDSTGTNWVYRRFSAGNASTGSGDSQEINYAATAQVEVPLDPSTEQSFQDATVYQIMRRLNNAKDGGIYPLGGTPTSAGIKAAGDHFLARQRGTSPFAPDQIDYAAPCRRRFAIVVTDGQSNSSSGISDDPEVVARKLYQGGRASSNFSGWNELGVYSGYPDNPIKTLAVGIPGLDSYTELNEIADQGADGLNNNVPASAYAPTSEVELERDIRAAITEAVSGDYVTTSLGVANTTTSVGTMAIIASTKFPEWEGQLRAFDLTASGGPAMAWDAGSQLYSANADVGFASRRIYTGYPTINSGAPVAILNADGTANLTAVLAAVAATGKTLPGTPAQQENMLRWVAGKGRNWRLSPIFNSVPATIGAEVPSYSGLTVSAREPLIYVTSHDGLLHAFRGRDGAEVFAYLPPNLLPRVYDLWAASNAPQRQDEDPEKFRWILGSSPRVQDVPSCTGGTCTWQTNLVLTMGASDNAFVVLDVTNPVVCTSAACSPSGSFFRVVGHSHVSGSGLEDKLGETWSVPAMFFGMTAGTKVAHMSMGSGYPPLLPAPANQGNYYFHFAPLRPTSGAAYTSYDPPTLHSAGAPLVDYAVIADTAGLVDSQHIGVATYQADLLGRVTKYPLGAATGRSDVIAAGAEHPFYYSPAVYEDGAGTYLVAVSGSAAEQVEQAGVEGKVYVLKNDAAFLSFALADICTQFGAAAPNCPSTRARPVAAPLMVKNDPGNAPARMEMFFAVYDPPPDNEPCASGVSYVFRFHIDTGVNPPNRLLSVHKYDGRAAGLTIVGGGIDVALGISGSGAQRATVVSLGGRPLGTGSVPGPAEVMVGSWREVP
ncbi:MAG: VWA domain-containing protein [Proteobacteria bacterium]|nr:VWA domain-containing protein [Pseudomonadota bacterium]